MRPFSSPSSILSTALLVASSLVSACASDDLVSECQGEKCDDLGGQYQAIGRFCAAHQTDDGVAPIANAERPVGFRDPVLALTINSDDAGFATPGGHQGLVGALEHLADRNVPATIFVGRQKLEAAAVELLRKRADLFLVATELEPDGKTWRDAASFPFARKDGSEKNNVDFDVLARILREQKRDLLNQGLLTSVSSWAFLRAGSGVPQDPNVGTRFLAQIHSGLGIGATWTEIINKQDKHSAASPCPANPDGSTAKLCSWTYNSSNTSLPGNSEHEWYCDDIYDEDDGSPIESKHLECESRYVDSVLERLDFGDKSSLLHLDMSPVSGVADARSVAINSLPALIDALQDGCDSLDPQEQRPCYRFVRLDDSSAFPGYGPTLVERIDAIGRLAEDTSVGAQHRYTVANLPANPNPQQGVPASDQRKNSGDTFVRVELSASALLSLPDLRMRLEIEPEGDFVHAPSSFVLPPLEECMDGPCLVSVERNLNEKLVTEQTSFNVYLARSDEHGEVVVVEGYLGQHKANNKDWTLTIEHPTGPSPLLSWSIFYLRDAIEWAKDELAAKKDDESNYLGDNSNVLAKRVLCDGLSKKTGTPQCNEDKTPTPIGVCFPGGSLFSTAPRP